MTENYLLSPTAIASVLTELDERVVTAGRIETSLRKHGGKFMPEKIPFEYGSEFYLNAVHGGKLLREVFNDVTEARVDYDKVRHGVLVLKALFEENDPNSIDELTRYVMGLVETTK